jgi:hypothetical protein
MFPDGCRSLFYHRRTSSFWKEQAVLDWKRQRDAPSSDSAAIGGAERENIDALMQLRAPKVEMRYGREVLEDQPLYSGGGTSSASASTSAIEIHEALSEKDIKRIAFELAEIRWVKLIM